jgi:hypothetical protein
MSVILYSTRRRSFDAEKLKLSPDGGDCGSKRSYGGAYGGVWRSMRFRDSGVWIQAIGFVLVRLAGIWLQSP